jgi:hypothetical protein
VAARAEAAKARRARGRASILRLHCKFDCIVNGGDGSGPTARLTDPMSVYIRLRYK